MTTEWALKRFWTGVTVEPLPEGFAVKLDGKPIRTPGRAQLILPTRAVANLVAEEWRAQDGKVRPATMPATRTANSAIDTLSAHRDAIVDDLSGYGGTDLLCYRAAEPSELRARQAAGWDPLLDWAASRFGAVLRTGDGVAAIEQDSVALSALRDEVARQSDFQIAAIHDLVVLSGSLVIALAVIEGVRSPEEAWDLSRIDENWQIEHWGEVEDAATVTHTKRAAFVHAARFHSLCEQAIAQSRHMS